MHKGDMGTLNFGEMHPATQYAVEYISHYLHNHDALALLETLLNCAISGNRLAEITGETLRRFINKEESSDRYIMGLAWFLYKQDEFIGKSILEYKPSLDGVTNHESIKAL